MSRSKMKSSSIYSRVTDATVLTISFLLLAMIIDFGSPSQVILNLFIYVAVMFVSLRSCKRFIFEFVHTQRRIINILLGNVSGLVIGAFLLYIGNVLFQGLGESILVVILSSILAFFILGTISPMVKSSHRDIIHH